MTRLRYSAKLRAMRVLLVSLFALLLSACDGGLWNNPYPAADDGRSILYSAFTGRPQHLDPPPATSENPSETISPLEKAFLILSRSTYTHSYSRIGS